LTQINTLIYYKNTVILIEIEEIFEFTL